MLNSSFSPNSRNVDFFLASYDLFETGLRTNVHIDTIIPVAWVYVLRPYFAYSQIDLVLFVHLSMWYRSHCLSHRSLTHRSPWGHGMSRLCIGGFFFVRFMYLHENEQKSMQFSKHKTLKLSS